MAQIKEMQILLREDRTRLAQQGKRIQQLESALADLAELDISTIDFVESVAQRLQTVTADLKRLDTAFETVEATQALDDLITRLSLFVKKEK
jgi:hypothetical protein